MVALVVVFISISVGMGATQVDRTHSYTRLRYSSLFSIFKVFNKYSYHQRGVRPQYLQVRKYSGLSEVTKLEIEFKHQIVLSVIIFVVLLTWIDLRAPSMV